MIIKCPTCHIDLDLNDLIYARCYECFSSYELDDDYSIIKYRHYPKLNRPIGYVFAFAFVCSILGLVILDKTKDPLIYASFESLFCILSIIVFIYNFYIALVHGVMFIKSGTIFIEKNPISFLVCVVINFVIIGVFIWFGVPAVKKTIDMISV